MLTAKIDEKDILPVVEEATDFEYFDGEEYKEVEDVDNQSACDDDNNKSE